MIQIILSLLFITFIPNISFGEKQNTNIIPDDIYYFREYQNILNDLPIIGQFDINISGREWQNFIKFEEQNTQTIESYNEEIETPKNISKVELNVPTGAKAHDYISLSKTQTIPGMQDYIKYVGNWANLRKHEVMLEPFSDTGNIATKISNILFLLKKSWPDLQGQFEYPNDPKRNRDGQKKSVLPTKQFVSFPIGEDLCQDDNPLCITLDVTSKKITNKKTKNTLGDKRIYEYTQLINSYLEKLDKQNLSLRCTNKQTFGGRFPSSLKYFKDGYINIIVAGLSNLKEEKQKQIELPPIESDLECKERIYNLILESNKGNPVDINTLRDEIDKICVNERLDKLKRNIKETMNEYSNLKSAFSKVIDKLFELGDSIENLSVNLYETSYNLDKPQDNNNKVPGKK